MIRLPPSVHGEGDKGFVAWLVARARKNKVAAFIRDGRQRWAAVHRLDAARIFRLALEKGVAGGIYHGVGDEGLAFGDLTRLSAGELGSPQFRGRRGARFAPLVSSWVFWLGWTAPPRAP